MKKVISVETLDALQAVSSELTELWIDALNQLDGGCAKGLKLARDLVESRIHSGLEVTRG